MILDPAVSLTDYAIAVEGVILAALLLRAPKSAGRFWFVLFFTFIAIAALLGGTVHGFVPDEATHMYTILWGATLVSIGLVTVAAAMAAANSGWGSTVRRVVATITIIGFVAYCNELLFVGQEFRMAIVVYLPATVFLLISFIAAYFRVGRAAGREPTILVGAVGMLLTFAAAGVQQTSLAIGRLDHNAVYHVIQAVALVMIYFGARALRCRAAS